MAKRKNKTSSRKKLSLGNRADYRGGGRVALQRGGPGRGQKEYEEIKEPTVPGEEPDKAGTPITETTGSGYLPTTSQMPSVKPVGDPKPAPTPAPTGIPQEVSDEDRQDITIPTPISESKDIAPALREREFRVSETGKRAEDIASGRKGLEELGLKADAAQMPTDEEALKKQQIDPTTGVIKKDDLKQLTSEDYQILKDQIRDEDVQRGVSQPGVSLPTPIEAGRMTADTVATDVQIDAAQGQLSDESLAKAAGVQRVAPIVGAEVEILPGALAERVVGTISPEAKAVAAQNIGINLARITRAKKQLSNAGLSDADITDLGNNPEILEDKLTDYSETQRGLIAGLPQEALVSQQIDTLLNGIEGGNIPTWASPAVSAVEQMLAERGLESSSIGRTGLVNAIIQSALPIAQSNAQAIQQSITQERTIEAQVFEANAARRQQTALTNASNVFQMDMAQFSADQQRVLSNSKFLQTVGLTEANMEQQATIQNALLLSQANLAEADFYQKAQIQNAQAFVNMDMANLNNDQQAVMVKAQQEQQILLSNQAANNAAEQFNATSENQTQQFMASLSTQINLNNAQRKDAMEQFNTSQSNQAEARKTARDTDVAKYNAQLAASVDQFSAQQDFSREQFNAQNALVIEQSNVQWRRDITKVNTAAQQQINMLNAQNAFGLNASTQAQLWQEVRDEFDYIWKSSENAANRETNIAVAGMAGEHSALKNGSNMTRLKHLMDLFKNDYYGGGE